MSVSWPTPNMSAVTDAPHRLLLSHFRSWLKTKARDVDVQLLESLLDLRGTYDDLDPTYWPAGSVQDLRLTTANSETGTRLRRPSQSEGSSAEAPDSRMATSCSHTEDPRSALGSIAI